jgi:integrase
MTIGSFPNLSAEAARKEARRILGEVDLGRDPEAEKQRQKLGQITLTAALDDYLATRNGLRQATASNYQRIVRQHFGDWSRQPLAAITTDAVLTRHRRITDQAGRGAATLSMKVLGAIFNFGMLKYRAEDGEPVLIHNPVRALVAFKAGHKQERRKTIVPSHELPKWWQGVQTLQSTAARDYLTLVLLTGLRRREASGLLWADIDFAARTLTIPAERAKNHHAHTLPLGPYLLGLLKRRQATTGGRVFPSAHPRGEHINTSTMTAAVKATGIPFTVHDLRRTFGTIAESLDVPHYALKRLLNHAEGGDVTGGYIVFDAQRLRKPMEAIERAILSMAEATPPTVVELRTTSPA